VTSLRQKLEAKKAGIQDVKPAIRIPAGLGLLDAALAMGCMVVEGVDWDSLIDPDVLLGMMASSRAYNQEFDRTRSVRASVKVKKEPKSKTRFRSYSYQDPSDYDS
jgi:hypothetical protein